MKKNLLVTIIVLITALTFMPVVQNGFTNWDDDVYVTENSHVVDGLTVSNIAWAFTAMHSANWHPLTWLSHQLDCELFGLNPAWHHAVNLVFHLANTILLYVLLYTMTGAMWRSGFVAALFALHPMHVESVAWVAERKDVLSTLFFMLTLWLYVRYVQQRTIVRYLCVVVCFMLGLMAKPMLVTLPFVLLLLDYWPLRRIGLSGVAQKQSVSDAITGSSGRERRLKNRKKEVVTTAEIQTKDTRRATYAWMVVEKVPLFVLAAISCWVTVTAQQQGNAIGSFSGYPIVSRIINVVCSYGSYLEKFLLPVNLSCYYPYILFGWESTIVPFLLIIVITAFCVLTLRRNPYLIAGWLWFLGSLVPVIGLIQVGSQAYADRYTYIPYIGLFIMVAWALPSLIGKVSAYKKGISVCAVLFVLSMIPVSWNRCIVWRNSETLWKDAVSKWPGSACPHFKLASVYAKNGMYSKAIYEYKIVMRLEPHNGMAQYYLGNVLLMSSRFDESIYHFTSALRLNYKTAKVYSDLGNAFFAISKPANAVKYCKEAIRLQPKDTIAYSTLGAALIKLGQYDEAMQALDTAIKIDPRYGPAYYHKGIAFLHQNRTPESICYFSDALRLGYKTADVYGQLAYAYLISGNPAKAVENCKEVLKIDLNNYKLDRTTGAMLAITYSNLGDAYTAGGDYEEAVKSYDKAIGLNPKNAETHASLGSALQKLGRLDDAQLHLQEAARLNLDYLSVKKNQE